MRLLVLCLLMIPAASVATAQGLPTPVLTFDHERTTYGPRELAPGQEATLATVLWRTCPSSAWHLPPSAALAVESKLPSGLALEVPDIRFPEQPCLTDFQVEVPATFTIRNAGAEPTEYLLDLTMHLPESGPLQGRSNDILFRLSFETMGEGAQPGDGSLGERSADGAAMDHAAESQPVPAPGALALVIALALVALAVMRRR